jgi:hypothetical protein
MTINGIDWLQDVQNASLTTDPASDVQAIAGVATDKAVTPANLMAALAALDFPIAMRSVTAALFTMGVLSSANDTSGVHLTATKSKAFGINADTGGAALTAGFIRAGAARMLIGTAITSGGDISTAGWEGLLKIIASCNVGGNQGGLMGHLESAGTLTLTGSINTVKAGVASFLDLAAGATVAAGTVVSAFGVNPANFGTVTGRTTLIHVTAPVAGNWGSFAELPSVSDACQAAAAGVTAGPHLKIYINGVLHTIPTVKA